MRLNLFLKTKAYTDEILTQIYKKFIKKVVTKIMGYTDIFINSLASRNQQTLTLKLSEQLFIFRPGLGIDGSGFSF